MMLADAVAAGATPDAISVWCKIVKWLTASRSDSAVWAIAFTINTWAASIKDARISVYDNVHLIFSAYKSDIKYAQLLERAENLTDENGHKELRIRIDRLLRYIDSKDAEFLSDTKSPGMFAMRIMWCAATISVFVILFEWYYNYMLVLLLPYPVFCLWQILRGRWSRVCVWWLRRRVYSSLKKIEKSCGEKVKEPPSMDDLKKRLGP